MEDAKNVSAMAHRDDGYGSKAELHAIAAVVGKVFGREALAKTKGIITAEGTARGQ